MSKSVGSALQAVGYKLDGSRLRTSPTQCGCSKVERKAAKKAVSIVHQRLSVASAEKFYRRAFKKVDSLTREQFKEMPFAVRALDAKILAHKLDIHPDHLTKNPDLHYFLRGCKFHSQAAKFPKVRLTIIDGEIALPFADGPRKWSQVKKHVRVYQTGSSSCRGQLMDYSLTDRGYVRHPDLSKIDRNTYQGEPLRLLNDAFVAVETHEQPPWGNEWVLVLAVDALKDRYSSREHGYFEILAPDGRRFVVGKQRQSRGFDLQPGRLAFVDPRFYRHFSGNPEPLRAEFALTEKQIEVVLNYLMNVAEGGLYQQATGNCVSDQQNVMELLGYKWDTRTTAFNYVLPIVPEGNGYVSSSVRTGFNLLSNAITYWMGAGSTRSGLVRNGKPVVDRARPERLFTSASELLDPSRGLVHSGFKSGQLIQQINAYRQEHGRFTIPPFLK